jgi:predicted amidohydrolase YtcJ
VYAAVTRRTLDGAHPEGWVPEQKIDVESALRAYTASAAWASFTEELTGSLSPGRLADIVVLSDNPFEVTPDSLLKVRVDRTIVGGREVYSRR